MFSKYLNKIFTIFNLIFEYLPAMNVELLKYEFKDNGEKNVGALF